MLFGLAKGDCAGASVWPRPQFRSYHGGEIIVLITALVREERAGHLSDPVLDGGEFVHQAVEYIRHGYTFYSPPRPDALSW